jgi:hypothetical protein
MIERSGRISLDPVIISIVGGTLTFWVVVAVLIIKLG